MCQSTNASHGLRIFYVSHVKRHDSDNLHYLVAVTWSLGLRSLNGNRNVKIKNRNPEVSKRRRGPDDFSTTATSEGRGPRQWRHRLQLRLQRQWRHRLQLRRPGQWRHRLTLRQQSTSVGKLLTFRQALVFIVCPKSKRKPTAVSITTSVITN